MTFYQNSKNDVRQLLSSIGDPIDLYVELTMSKAKDSLIRLLCDSRTATLYDSTVYFDSLERSQGLGRDL